MEALITSPEKFADWFNRRVPGAYRPITVDDLKAWEKLSMIRRYGYYYSRDDLKTILGILAWEKEIIRKTRVNDTVGRICKGCGQPLEEVSGKPAGRPKEYCSSCQPKRAGWRNRKSRERKLQKTL